MSKINKKQSKLISSFIENIVDKQYVEAKPLLNKIIEMKIKDKINKVIKEASYQFIAPEIAEILIDKFNIEDDLAEDASIAISKNPDYIKSELEDILEPEDVPKALKLIQNIMNKVIKEEIDINVERHLSNAKRNINTAIDNIDDKDDINVERHLSNAK